MRVRVSYARLGLITLAALAACPPTSAGAGPEAARPTNAWLQGRVMDARGAPIAGATIGAFDDLAAFHRLARYESLKEPRPLDPLSEARTDAQGAFRCGGLAPGSYTLVARAKGRGVGVLDSTLATMGGSPSYVLPLGEETGIQGQVIDRTGKPVASAAVSAGEAFEGVADDTYNFYGRVYGSTDREGRFSVDGVATAFPTGGPISVRSYSVCVRSPEGWIIERVFKALPEEETAIRTGGAASLGGTVRTHSGQPVPNATARLLLQWDEPDGRSSCECLAHCDSQGTYRVDGLPTGQSAMVNFQAWAPGVGVVQGPYAGIPVREAGVTVIDATLIPPLTVHGHIVDPTGTPAPPRTEVLLTRGSGGFAWQTTTDDKGQWEIRGLPQGLEKTSNLAHALEVHVPGEAGAVPHAKAVIDPPPGTADVQHDVQLEKPTPVSLQVIDSEGKPVPNATVWPRGATTLWASTSVRTGADGRAVLPVRVGTTGLEAFRPGREFILDNVKVPWHPAPGVEPKDVVIKWDPP